MRDKPNATISIMKMDRIGRILQGWRIVAFLLLGFFLTVTQRCLGSLSSFDRVRIIINTTSDWTHLELRGSERFTQAKGTPQEGTPGYHWNGTSLGVTQSLADARDGKSVQVQFDVILASETPISIAFESTKGDLGTTQIALFQFNTDTPQLVRRVSNTNSSGHPNPRTFSASAASLLEGEFSFPSPAIPPLLLAFYYPWYHVDSWGSSTLLDLPFVPYSSENLSVITQHVHWAKQAGIDGFISSWWGPGSYTDYNLKKLLPVAAGLDFKVSIYFETLGGGGPRPKEEILSWLRYFFETYGDDARFFHLEGKPVIFIWAAGTISVGVWGEIFDTLRVEGHLGVYLANTLNPSYLLAFDGLHDYAAAFRGEIEEDFQEASLACKTYGWLDEDPELRIWAATIQPGYDDTLIPGREGHIIERLDGAIYDRTFEASLQSEPAWILITSFNEWWENTHIESSRNYGIRYSELTAQYADRFKGFEPRAPSSFHVPVISDPDGTVPLSWDPPLAQSPDSYIVYRGTLPRDLQLLKTGLTETAFSDLPLTDGKYDYAVSAVFGGTKGPLSEVLRAFSNRGKSRADPGVEIPVDIALYTESTSWIPRTEAQRQAGLLIQKVRDRVNQIRIVGASALSGWILSHTKNSQRDIILFFGDIPDSIYPSGNEEPERSLAEAFLDDGNILLNTADYAFYGGGRNDAEGLMNLMDIPTTMWGDDVVVSVTDAGQEFTPSLQNFSTSRPFHIDELEGTQWEVEVSFADNGVDRGDPAIIRHGVTGGRIGIIYQKQDDSLPRAQVIGEMILNWLPTVLPPRERFRRGDTDGNGKLDLTDAIQVLNFQFVGSMDHLDCMDAADVDDSGDLDLTDSIRSLNFQFTGTAPAPEPPGPHQCGPDGEEDSFPPCDYPQEKCQE